MSDLAAHAAGIVWQWRRSGGDDAARAGAAAAARKKGLLGGVIGLAVATAVWFWRPGMGYVVAGIALLFTVLALVSPLGAYRRLTRLLDRFGYLVGAAMTWLLLGLAYGLLFVPVGVLLRNTGKLRITRGADPRLSTYWTTVPPRERTLDDYRRSF